MKKEPTKKVKKEKNHENFNPPVIEVRASYSLKYHSGYAEQLFNHMRQGYSFSSYRAEPPLAPVAPQTLYKWLKDWPDFAKARDDGESFFQKILEKNATIKATGVIPLGMESITENADLSAIKFLLERRYANTYKQKVDNVIQNPDGTAIQQPPTNLNLSKLSDREIEAMIKLHEKASKE